MAILCIAKSRDHVFQRRHDLISSPLPAPLPSPLSSMPFPPPLFAPRRASSNSSSVIRRSPGSGANSSMERMTRSTEERKEFVAKRSRRTVVAVKSLLSQSAAWRQAVRKRKGPRCTR